jgi:hypothetical protein
MWDENNLSAGVLQTRTNNLCYMKVSFFAPAIFSNNGPPLNFHSAALHCLSSRILYSPGGSLCAQFCMELDSGEHMLWRPVGVVDILQHSCRY